MHTHARDWGNSRCVCWCTAVFDLLKQCAEVRTQQVSIRVAPHTNLPSPRDPRSRIAACQGQPPLWTTVKVHEEVKCNTHTEYNAGYSRQAEFIPQSVICICATSNKHVHGKFIQCYSYYSLVKIWFGSAKTRIWISFSGKQIACLVCGCVTQLRMHMQVTAGAKLTAAVLQHLKESFPTCYYFVFWFFFIVFSLYRVASG